MNKAGSIQPDQLNSGYIDQKTESNLMHKPVQKEIHQPLLDACIHNDARAQKEIYDLYSVAVFNTCRRILANRDDAQDILQESFIAAFRGIKNFNRESTFGTWLKRIAINKCISYLKQKKRLQFESLKENHNSHTDHSGTENEDISIQAINEAILNLPGGCRTVFVMKAMEEYDHSEIAHALNISIGTSKSQYNRAKQLLQEYLEKNAI